jgi:hypothetical protein
LRPSSGNGLWLARRANRFGRRCKSSKHMPRGSSPGEHRGGRAVGTPNKFGEQRALAVEREGKRLPPANLLVIAENSMAMAARFQPDLTDPETKERRANPQYNEERYAFWLDRSREALRDAAPYYSPKLHAIAVAQTLTVDDKVGRVDPREQMWQTYKAMRERGEIAMKTIGSTETSPNSGPADIEAKVEEDNGDGEDDGDGVAA